MENPLSNKNSQARAMVVPGYTAEFWIRAIELATQQPKQCEQCHRPNGWVKDDSKRKNKAKPLLVRPALRIGNGIYQANLGLFCTNCRRGKQVPKMSKAELDALILPLFPQSSNALW